MTRVGVGFVAGWTGCWGSRPGGVRWDLRWPRTVWNGKLGLWSWWVCGSAAAHGTGPADGLLVRGAVGRCRWEGTGTWWHLALPWSALERCSDAWNLDRSNCVSEQSDLAPL